MSDGAEQLGCGRFRGRDFPSTQLRQKCLRWGRGGGRGGEGRELQAGGFQGLSPPGTQLSQTRDSSLLGAQTNCITGDPQGTRPRRQGRRGNRVFSSPCYIGHFLLLGLTQVARSHRGRGALSRCHPLPCTERLLFAQLRSLHHRHEYHCTEP